MGVLLPWTVITLWGWRPGDTLMRRSARTLQESPEKTENAEKLPYNLQGWSMMWLSGCPLSLWLLSSFQIKGSKWDRDVADCICEEDELECQLIAETKATWERKFVCHICTNMCTLMVITIVIVYYCYTILIIYSMIIKYITLNITPKQITFYQLKQTN